MTRAAKLGPVAAIVGFLAFVEFTSGILQGYYTPLLTDIFHAERWDYVYWRERPGVKREQRKLIVFFEDGRVTRIDGDVVAAGATN